MNIETANTILTVLIIALVLALIFSAQVLATIKTAIRLVGYRNHTHAGVKILRRQVYIDIKTNEAFERWNTVNGVRHQLISNLMRF